MIKFDLHIHSKESEYKEDGKIVSESTPQNAEMLLSKLDENDVALFSITDHNRFNVELYQKLDSLLQSERWQNSNVKGLIAGVEFDVQLTEDMGKCHIMAYFNAKNQADNYQKIKDAIENNGFLVKKTDYYNKEQFSKILNDIGLDVILIACQRSSLNKSDKSHNSLSEAVSNPYRVLQSGYISALEFQKPKTEGILINNLKDFPTHIALVSGSDCHDWNQYPYHDASSQNKDFAYSKARILPTFKGLLMAITSPETRFNLQENTNTDYVEKIIIDDKIIPLENGINAIIGENGSGKSTLLKLLSSEKMEPFAKTIITDSKLSIGNNLDKSKILYIGQGDIVEKYNNNSLFSIYDGALFSPLDTEPFQEIYKTFSKKIKNNIIKQCKKKEYYDKLEKAVLSVNSINTKTGYYISIEEYKTFDKITNIHREPLTEIEELFNCVQNLMKNEYFEKYKNDLQIVKNKIQEIKQDIENNSNELQDEIQTKNVIVSLINEYMDKVLSKSNNMDREYINKNKNREVFIDNIILAIKEGLEVIDWPDPPLPMAGATENNLYGFKFKVVATYDQKNMFEKFLQTMFTKEYADYEKVKLINTEQEWIKAVRNVSTDFDSANSQYDNNLEAFLHEAIEVKGDIIDGAEKRVGNTLGERALSYYKYIAQNFGDYNLLSIDQPEDNISNKNINQNLISYLNSIRHDKQIVFVTHNPLLVVNADVDNVIYTQKSGKKIEIVAGCLEYENGEISMLDIIANSMDGGRQSIEKRLKVYGKESENCNE